MDKIWITCCNVWLKCTGKHGMMDWKTSWCMSTFFGPTCLCVELQLDGGTWFSYFIFDALQCYLISSKTRKVMDIVYSRLSFKIWMEQEVGKVGGWRSGGRICNSSSDYFFINLEFFNVCFESYLNWGNRGCNEDYKLPLLKSSWGRLLAESNHKLNCHHWVVSFSSCSCLLFLWHIFKIT